MVDTQSRLTLTLPIEDGNRLSLELTKAGYDQKVSAVKDGYITISWPAIMGLGKPLGEDGVELYRKYVGGNKK